MNPKPCWRVWVILFFIGFDPHSNVAMDWGVYGAPETFLIDAEGMIRAKHAGAMTPQVWEEKFRTYFEKGSNTP